MGLHPVHLALDEGDRSRNWLGWQGGCRDAEDLAGLQQVRVAKGIAVPEHRPLRCRCKVLSGQSVKAVTGLDGVVQIQR